MSEHNFLSSELEVAVNNSNSDVNEHVNDDNVKNKFDDKVLLRLQNMAVTPLLWHFVLPAILANSISAVTNAIQTTIQKNVMGNIIAIQQQTIRALLTIIANKTIIVSIV
ncbi:MatE_efflux family protein [Hexamita inflata]|uniref:MatE efflux family protein n=1 Tax=Hexamita inflata TaxID=28002 RepID=A0AA86UH32_9EUKA|nr:MatE efflux family protein [Hexamita inflata]